MHARTQTHKMSPKHMCLQTWDHFNSHSHNTLRENDQICIVMLIKSFSKTTYLLGKDNRLYIFLTDKIPTFLKLFFFFFWSSAPVSVMFISHRVTNVRNTHSQVKTILVFPVKAPQLLSDIQHMLQAHCLFENVTGTSVLTYGKCLCACVESPVAERGQMSEGVPLALAGRNLR